MSQHRAFSGSNKNNNELSADTTNTDCANEIRLHSSNEKQFYRTSTNHSSDMKFQHLSHDENGPSVVIGSNSAFKGIKTGVSKIEDKHGLPRPPFVNNIEGDNRTANRQDSLNGNTRDGVELQQKKVCLISYVYRHCRFSFTFVQEDKMYYLFENIDNISGGAASKNQSKIRSASIRRRGLER